METAEPGGAPFLRELVVMNQAALIRVLVLSWREALEAVGIQILIFLPAPKCTKLGTARARRVLECRGPEPVSSLANQLSGACTTVVSPKA